MENNKTLSIMNVGKYKNKSIEYVYNDKDYFNWIMKQQWFMNNCVYKFLKDFKPNEPIYINNKTGIILCDDILEMIGNEFKKIPNKLVDKIKFSCRCNACDKLEFCYGINIFKDRDENNCYDCKRKDMLRREKLNRHKINKNKKYNPFFYNGFSQYDF